jgi:hypothetical protein
MGADVSVASQDTRPRWQQSPHPSIARVTLDVSPPSRPPRPASESAAFVSSTGQREGGTERPLPHPGYNWRNQLNFTISERARGFSPPATGSRVL